MHMVLHFGFHDQNFYMHLLSPKSVSQAQYMI